MPEAVHQYRRRHQEGDQQQSAEVGPDADGHHEATEDDHGAGEGRHQPSCRHTLARRVAGHHLPLGEVAHPGAQKQESEQDPADEDHNVHESSSYANSILTFCK